MKMKRILFVLCLFFTVMQYGYCEETVLNLRRAPGGAYGYVGKDRKWEIAPQYYDAEPYSGKFAAVSFDGVNYGLINRYGGIVTELCFKGKPRNIFRGVAVVYPEKDKNGSNYLVSLNGKTLTEGKRGLNFSNGIISLSVDARNNKRMADGNLNAFGPEYNATDISLVTRKVKIDGEEYSFPLVKYDSRVPGSSISIMHYTDADGRTFDDNLDYARVVDYNVYIYNKKDAKKMPEAEDFAKLMFVARNKANGKYGIYFIDGTELLPPTGKVPHDVLKKLKKEFKKKIYPKIADGTLKEKAKKGMASLNDVYENRVKANFAALSVDADAEPSEIDVKYFYAKPEPLAAGGKTKKKAGKSKSRSKSGKKGQRSSGLMHLANPNGSSKKYSSEKFSEVVQEGMIYKARKPGSKKYYMYNSYGIQQSPEGYDEITYMHGSDDMESRYQVRVGKEYGLVDGLGREILAPQYSEITKAYDKNNILIAKCDGKYHLFNMNTGRMLNNNAYDEVSKSADKNDRIEVKRLGYTTYVGSDGKETPSIARILFDDAYAMQKDESSNPQTVLEAYAKVLQNCSSDDRDVLGATYCNLGYIYEMAGQQDNAKKFYSQGASYGSAVAKSNLSNMKKAERSAKWSSIFGALNTVAQGVGEMAGSNSAFAGFAAGLNGQGVGTGAGSYSGGGTGSVSGGYGGSSSGGSSEVKSGADASYYQSMYDRWEREAKSNYEALTRGGTRTQKNGKDDSGTTDGYWKHHTAGLKRLLRSAQNEMRKIRLEASRAGVRLNQSNYESVHVSY